MGGELAQGREWDHDGALDWHLLDDEAPRRRPTLDPRPQRAAPRPNPRCTSATATPRDSVGSIADDADDGVLGFYRYDASGAPLLFIANFTPIVRDFYRVPVPCGGFWRELVNTDAAVYGGSGTGNLGGVEAVPVPLREWYWSLTLQLPPLGALFLRPDP